MPFYNCFRSLVLEMVSNKNSRTIGEEKEEWTTTWGEEEERDFEREIHKK